MKIFVTICLLLITFSHADNSENPEVDLMRTLQGWNDANNAQDTDALSRLYASKVIYYGSKFTRNKCIKDKKRFFKKYSYFSQSIKKITYTSLTPRLHRITFDKYVRITPNKGVKMYPSYLVVNTASAFPAIVEEGDVVTDKNLKRKKNIKSFSFNGTHKIKGIIKKVKHYGPPGYGENPREDMLLTAYILKLNHPIKVIESNPDEMNYTTTATEIQLLAFDFLELLGIAAKKHKKVTLNGEFFSGHTGYHIRDLLMDVKSVKF